MTAPAPGPRPATPWDRRTGSQIGDIARHPNGVGCVLDPRQTRNAANDVARQRPRRTSRRRAAAYRADRAPDKPRGAQHPRFRRRTRPATDARLRTPPRIGREHEFRSEGPRPVRSHRAPSTAPNGSSAGPIRRRHCRCRGTSLESTQAVPAQSCLTVFGREPCSALQPSRAIRRGVRVDCSQQFVSKRRRVGNGIVVAQVPGEHGPVFLGIQSRGGPEARGHTGASSLTLW